MLSQLEHRTLLGRSIAVKVGQRRGVAEERDQLILDTIWCFDDLRIRPAKHTPALKDHTVLFEQVIDILVL